MSRIVELNKGYYSFSIEVSIDIAIKCSADIHVDDHHLVDGCCFGGCIQDGS